MIIKNEIKILHISSEVRHDMWTVIEMKIKTKRPKHSNIAQVSISLKLHLVEILFSFLLLHMFSSMHSYHLGEDCIESGKPQAQV